MQPTLRLYQSHLVVFFMPRQGESFEKNIAEDLGTKRTCNSGAKWGNGDLQHPDAILEAKDRGAEGFSMPYKDFLKLKKEMLAHHRRYWAYFVRNVHGDKVVVIPYEVAVAMFAVGGDDNNHRCSNCGHVEPIKV